MKTKLSLLTLSILLLSLSQAMSQPVIQLRRAVIDIEEGHPLGVNGITTVKTQEFNPELFRLYYNNPFRFRNGFTEEFIKQEIGKAFVEKGMRVEGYDHFFAEYQTNPKPRYSFTFILKNIQFISRGVSYFNEFKSKMEYDILILDMLTNELVFQELRSVDFYSDKKGHIRKSRNYSNYFIGSFNALVDLVLKDEEIMALLEHKNDAISELTDSTLIVNIKTPDQSWSPNEAINSTVTVAVGGGHGSGAIISTDGVVLTCYHNLGASKEVDIILSNGMKTKAKVIRTMPSEDLALVKIDALETIPIPLASVKSQPTDVVWAIGTPASKLLGQSISKGILSGYRTIEDKYYIQTDASVSPGNSGGPLLNDKGELIGIISSKVIREGTEGVGFAIPISVASEKLRMEMRE